MWKVELSLTVDVGMGKVTGRSGGLEKSHTYARGPDLEPGACRWVLGSVVSALPTLPGLPGAGNHNEVDRQNTRGGGYLLTVPASGLNFTRRLTLSKEKNLLPAMT